MGKRVNLAELAHDDISDVTETPRTDTPDTGHRDGAGPDRVPTAAIASNPLNPRPSADLADEEFDQLVATIREHGVLQPIVVCTAAAFLARYPEQQAEVEPAQWVALLGNRRLLATRMADVELVPIVVDDARVATMYEVILIENSHRRDLGPVYEAEAMQHVLTDSGISQRELATRIGRTHVYIAQRLALLGLIPQLRAALDTGQLKVEHARQIGKLSTEQQEAIAASGPPYRPHPPATGNAVTSRRHTITTTTPAHAADSIRKLFSPDELTELITLLSQRSDT